MSCADHQLQTGRCKQLHPNGHFGQGRHAPWIKLLTSAACMGPESTSSSPVQVEGSDAKSITGPKGFGTWLPTRSELRIYFLELRTPLAYFAFIVLSVGLPRLPR